MAYTPPAGGALNVIELATAAYTPPASTPVVVDLAVEESTAGVVEFVAAIGAMTLAGFVPSKAVLSHVIPLATLTLAGQLPSYTKTRTDTQSTAGAMTLTAYAPTTTTAQVSVISATGAMVLAAYQFTQFKGLTQTIAQIGALTLTANAAITQTRASSNTIPLGTLVLAADPVTQVFLVTLGQCAAMTLAPEPVITQSLKIRSEIDSRYFTPDITLTDTGVMTFATFPVLTEFRRIRGECTAVYGITHILTVGITGLYTERFSFGIAGTYDIQSRVLADKASLYSIKLTNRVVTSITAPYRLPIVAAVDSLYSMVVSIKVRAGVTSAYSLIQPIPVRVGVTGLYRLVQNVAVKQSVSSLYALFQPTPVRTGIAGVYTLIQLIPARNSIAGLYSSIANTKIRAELYSSYLTRYLVRSGPVATYSMTTPANRGITSYYNIQSVMKAQTAVEGIYSATDAQVISITEAPYLEYFGARMGISEAELSIAEGDYAWKSSVVLTHVNDYAKLRQSEPFSIVIGVERYEFIVDSKELDRSKPANYAMKLLGISPSAKFSTPRHVSSSYLWDTFVNAKAVAEEVLPGIDWQILDWGIPAYRLAAQASTPVEVVQVITAAVGATVETNIDGTLYVRSLFPVSVPNYAAATPAHILLEDMDILRVNESYVSIDVFNRLIITDIAQDISDSLEWIPDYNEATTGVMRAYLYPWRSAVALLHTGLPAISISDPSMVMEEHTEVIEIFQGSGTAGFPIHHVESVEYEAQNVGAVVFDPDSRSFTVGGPAFNSVIRLVYWTRSLDYRVALPTTRPTQFLLESEPL